MRVKRILFTIIPAIVLIGCARAPEKEINDAMAAMSAAKTAQADRYSKDLFESGEKLIASMNEEIKKQSFDKAKSIAIDARSAFDRSRDEAERMKEALTAEMDGLFSKAQNALLSAEELYAKKKSALKSKNVNISSWSSGLKDSFALILGAEEDKKASRLLDARLKLEGAIAKLGELEDEARKALAE